MWPLARALLFSLPAETAHDLTFALLKIGHRLGLWHKKPPITEPVEVWGLHFAHRLGLAAGLDKNGELLAFWAHLGFAFVEVGTVTPKPQPGNPRPRLFRIPADQALLNRMGFNSLGARIVAQNLQSRPSGLIVGINLGKNKMTPLEEAHKDYAEAMQILYDLGDYFVINVSSPNTPGLRCLQSPEALTRIVEAIQKHNLKQAPLLVKLSPDLSPTEIEAIGKWAIEQGIAGFIAGNTTTQITYAHLGPGGVSGKPLKPLRTELIRQLRTTGLPIIGCGGIFSRTDLEEVTDWGATLCQVYTSLIYEGPNLPKALIGPLP